MAKMVWHGDISAKLAQKVQAAQMALDNEVVRQMEPYMPTESGNTIRSMQQHTQPGSGHVVVKTPYAANAYHTAKAVGQRGPWYFERMKADKKDHLLEVARKAAGAK